MDDRALNSLTNDLNNTLPNCIEWWVDWKLSRVIVLTLESSDLDKRNNGGNYDYYRIFTVTESGITACDEWSAEFDINSKIVTHHTTISLDQLIQICEQIAPALRVGGLPYSIPGDPDMDFDVPMLDLSKYDSVEE